MLLTRYPFGMLCTTVERARRPQRVSSGLLIMELANLLCVKAASHKLRKTLRRFALTRKFCQPFGKLPDDTNPTGRKEVTHA
jgi:hypothetical protein